MTSIGLMFAVGILVYGFAAPASGWLSDRLGRIQVTRLPSSSSSLPRWLHPRLPVDWDRN
jgi:MFS family permease